MKIPSAWSFCNAFGTLAFMRSLIQGQSVNAEESPKQICVSETDCYPELFEPQGEFKIVREGQQLPPGLHIRLNFETGLKEAKLNSDATPASGHASVNVASNQHELAVTPVTVELPIKDSILPPTVDEKNKGQKTHITVQPGRTRLTLEEKESLKNTLGLLGNATEDTILTQLQYLSDIVHDIDIGLGLTLDREGMDRILELMGQSGNPQIRSETALLLGNAVSNNPEAHKAALSHPDLLDTLLSALGTELDVRVRHRFLFALGSLIRSDRAALVIFYERKGLEVLEALFNSKSTDKDLEGKLLDLVRDALDKDMFPILSVENSTKKEKNSFLTGQELVSKGYWTGESISFWCAAALPGSDLVAFLESQFGTRCSSN